MIENIICIDNSSNRTYLDWAIVVVSILLYVFLTEQKLEFLDRVGRTMFHGQHYYPDCPGFLPNRILSKI